MGFFRSVSGIVRAELTGADIFGTLKLLSDHQIAIHDLATVDELTVRFSVSRQNYRRSEQLCRKDGSSIRVIQKRGIHWPIASLHKRPVLLGGMILFVFLAAFLPSRVLLIQVQGNSKIPRHQILEAAADCGIRFGASRRLVRSEQMKNSLLGALPELQWAGVNTYGCRAVISVRERPTEEKTTDHSGVSSIVASMDGVITDCTAAKGNALCKPGQAVAKGQVLISGYTDCGITIQATRAEGEVFALTKREVTVVTPSEHLIRTVQKQPKAYYSLILGKKRINFYKGSGISGGSCVKMYSKYVLTLPGGFELPLAVIKETITPATAEQVQISNSEEMLRTDAELYLSDQMISGRILERSDQIRGENGVFRLLGRYSCLESIGIRREEKIGEHNGETNGTDRER